jgi:cleavage and polyadenylation specificity factor subunit 3
MPISAFGNVQELLLILDEHWSNHPELHNIPIYYASGLAFRGMQVYRTYIHTMNDHVKSRFSRDRNDNPFAFKYVRNVKDFRKWKDSGPCVMMATPQMLQGYHSRELLENWAPDRKNGLVITGYSIEGTMAKVSSSFDVVVGLRSDGQRRRVGARAVRYVNHPMTNMIHRRERQIPFRCRSDLLDQSSPYPSVPDLQIYV